MTPGVCSSILIELPVAHIERHLGVPAGAQRCAQWPHLIDSARRWCREYVTPSVRTRHVTIAGISGDVVELERGKQLTSSLLAKRLRTTGAHALIVAAFSAGHEIDDEINRLWDAGRPDAAMVLNAFGSVLIEQLRACVARQLRRTMGARGMRVLPHLSPGYDGWPLEDQANLFSLIAAAAGPIELLDSGGLRPSKSMLAAFGLARVRATAAPGGNASEFRTRTWAEQQWQTAFLTG